MRCGDDLFSISVATPADAQALAARLRTAGDWLEVVPGIASVVVQFDAAQQEAQDVRRAIDAVLARGIVPLKVANELVEIPVVYGGDYGPDMEALCARTGLSAAAIIALHTGREYVVDMIGFLPGFAFIGGLDERLNVPRRSEPRQRVPAGSVGIADGRTGLYAVDSPGGWTLIGRTSYKLLDPGADDPVVLHPGMRVRFTAIAPGDS